MHSITASLNLGQDMANKRKLIAAYIVAKSYSLYLVVKIYRYGSLININLSIGMEVWLFDCLSCIVCRSVFSVEVFFYL